MFCNIVKGLGLTCTCIVLAVSLIRGSRELDRRIRVGLGVSSVFKGLSSIATSLAKGML
jgi:type IV secretory pathway VirB2 component (pilin)